MSEADERVRAQLEQMTRNFAGLADSFQVVGRNIAKLGKPLNKLAGRQAAMEDWGSKLWFGIDDTKDEDRDDDPDTDKLRP